MSKLRNYRILLILGIVLLLAGLEVLSNFNSASAKQSGPQNKAVQEISPPAFKAAPNQGLTSSFSKAQAADGDAKLAAAIKKAADRSTEGLVEEPIPGGGYGIDLQGRFQNVTITKAGPEGQAANACVTSLGEANDFFGRNLETGEALPTTQGPPVAAKPHNHEMTRQEFEFYQWLIKDAARRRALSPNAATLTIVNGDDPGEGFNDAAPRMPEGGNTGTTLGQQRLNLFNFAAGIWGAFLDSNVTIRIRSQFNPLECSAGSGILGSAGTIGIFRDFPNSEFAGTWHHVALANKRAGSDLSAANDDINATFNSSIDNACLGFVTRYYYGLDTAAPANTIPLLTTLLHELAHGLGFSTFANSSTGALLMGFPDVYNRFMFDRTVNLTWPAMTDAQRQTSAINTGNVLWDGPNVRIASGFLTAGREASTGRVQLFTPNPVQTGSSVSHFSNVTFPNLLMEPSEAPGVTATLDLTRQQMRDIGWYRDTTADLTPDTITNVQPSGGVFLPGANVNITWTNNGGFDRNVTIDLSADGGLTYPFILVSGIPNTGSRAVTVPSVSTSQGRIRVREHDFVVPAGVSSSSFIIGNGTPTPTPDPACTPAVFRFAGAPVAIPDNNPAGANATITVSGFSGVVSDLNFRFDGTASSADPNSTTVGLNHSFLGDLSFRLTSPAGTTVTIMNRGGGAPDCPANNIFNLTLDDEATANVTCPGGDNGGPLTGNFRPDNPLAAFDEQNPNGVWTLNVADTGPADLGSIRAFSLNIAPFTCGTPTPTPTPTPSTLQFSAATVTANEGVGKATLSVIRVGDTTTAAAVDYATQDNFAFALCNAAGNSNQRCDYTPARGTLSFAAGETNKSFDVLINDDLYVEGNETVNLVLSNPTGAMLGPNANAVLTITDNDTTAGANRVFVARLDAAQEVPTNNSTATGSGNVTLNAAENQITVNMTFSGLSSAQTAAHIHGPAPVGQNAPVLFNLGPGQISNATFAVTPAQVAQMRAGMFYFNVHTANFPGGEIRGQIASQPLENARFFVRQQYADFLSREPDQAGFDFWTGQITNICGADLACTRQRRVDVSNAFFFEQEFQQTGAYVYRLYRAAYGATQPFPNPESATLPNYEVFVNDRARVVGGASLSAAQLALANAFTARTEFLARYPASQTAAQFVDAILGNIQAATGANLTSQRDALIALHGTGGRGAVVYRLVDDNIATNPINNRAFIDAEYNRAFVITQYFGYLRRDADFAGFNFWLGVVNQFPLRSPVGQNGMVCAFITSQEYQERFSAGVTRANQECP